VPLKTRLHPPQGNADLMAEKTILDFKPAPRLEHVGKEHSERVRRMLALAPDFVFGKQLNHLLSRIVTQER